MQVSESPPAGSQSPRGTIGPSRVSIQAVRARRATRSRRASFSIGGPYAAAASSSTALADDFHELRQALQRREVFVAPRHGADARAAVGEQGLAAAELHRAGYDPSGPAEEVAERGLPGDVYRAATIRTGRFVR